MTHNRVCSFSISVLMLTIVNPIFAQPLSTNRPLVIAHRGASGYLPEHTLEATALAYGMGADFIEQDVVLTNDNVPVVIHDIFLDAVTNVATRFPGRARNDGRFYVADFSWQEIQTLNVNERIDLETGKRDFNSRFPAAKSSFKVPSLQQSIELIQGLNQTTGRRVGIYPEIKKPAWHRRQGKDISPLVIKLLQNYGYSDKDDLVYLQCFDSVELSRIRKELNCKLKLVQLIGNDEWEESDTNYTEMVTREGIKKVASYADGIGPWMPLLLDLAPDNHTEGPGPSELILFARQHKLTVHAFTFRADRLPDYVNSFQELAALFCNRIKVDGVFTDHPDRFRTSTGR